MPGDGIHGDGSGDAVRRMLPGLPASGWMPPTTLETEGCLWKYPGRDGHCHIADIGTETTVDKNRQDNRIKSYKRPWVS